MLKKKIDMKYFVETTFKLDEYRWMAEREEAVLHFITKQLIKFGASVAKPNLVHVYLSPALAMEIGCNNPEEFKKLILGVPIEFCIVWTLQDNQLELTIS